MPDDTRKDYLVRALAYDGRVRALAVRLTKTAGEAQKRHHTLPTATAALGRTLAATVLMGSLLKPGDTVTVQIQGDGPLGHVVADADAAGNVRGYVHNRNVDLPINSSGKLDVAGAVGRNGYLYVIKDLGLKEPYRGSVPLVSGEIAEDFTYYFARSEQTPSAVALGVLVAPDGSVRAAGGLILQLLPGATEEDAVCLEDHIKRLEPISTLFDHGLSPEEAVERAVGDEGRAEFVASEEVRFHCDCSRERLERVLVSLGEQELEDLARKKDGTELVCRFCNSRYRFSAQEIRRLLAEVAGGH